VVAELPGGSTHRAPSGFGADHVLDLAGRTLWRSGGGWKNHGLFRPVRLRGIDGGFRAKVERRCEGGVGGGLFLRLGTASHLAVGRK